MSFFYLARDRMCFCLPRSHQLLFLFTSFLRVYFCSVRLYDESHVIYFFVPIFFVVVLLDYPICVWTNFWCSSPLSKWYHAILVDPLCFVRVSLTKNSRIAWHLAISWWPLVPASVQIWLSKRKCMIVWISLLLSRKKVVIKHRQIQTQHFLFPHTCWLSRQKIWRS